MMGMAQALNRVKFLLNDNSTVILTAAGIVGTVGTSYLTGRASFKAADLIARESVEHEAHEDPQNSGQFVGRAVLKELSKTEKAKLVWHLYLPAVGVGAITITSIIVAHRISSKQIAALAIASGISERALQEYKGKVIEKLGERQDEKIRDEIAQDRVTANPPTSGEVILVGTGQVLCYDITTGRYFQSTVEDIRKAENRVNYELIHYDSCSLSMFYDEIGLPPTPYTDSVGWNIGNHMEIKLSTVMSEDNRPCIAIDFSRPPVPDYQKNWT